ncbi:pineapple eye protein [Zeugodacus cucurbitae]|uniref:pineapple eye protein n=1 Tax=Zeugodacus cucurbitae TaxID=28588 RepID=UPI0023D964FB|nr:pineapple eye protein [Zeugodacus cucurbitae]
MSEKVYKICDICKDKTNCDYDLLIFGDWQHSRDITVHYFCLLLSTHLPQRGKDCSGINGFLVRDIRKEISAASKRVCCYCGRHNASIQCFKCNEYFHLACGRTYRCLFRFVDDFRSYCDECVPKKELQSVTFQKRPSSLTRCIICRDQMGLYDEVIFIFGKCCNDGYAHNVCVQQYALAAGYYLRCLWCGSKEFRDSVRSQGIFVPDRDARWELQKGIYTDLHRGHSTCNMDVCLCPKGRDYNRGKWSVILCSLCGSVGAHNPKCLLGKENAKEPLTTFKCATCANTESNVSNLEKRELNATNTNDIIDKSIFMTKNNTNVNKQVVSNLVASFSEDEDTQSCDSFVTVIPQNGSKLNASNSSVPVNENRTDNSIAEASPESVHNNSVVEVQKTIVIHSTQSGSSDENSRNVSKEVPSPGVILSVCEEDTTNVVKETLPEPQSSTQFIEDDETQIFGTDIFQENTIKATSTAKKQLNYEIQDDETQEFNESSSKISKTNVSVMQPLESQNTTEAASSTTPMCLESTLNLVSSQTANSPDNMYQSPVVSSSSQLEELEEWACFQVYDYDDAEGNCIGSATARINLNDERFAGLTLQDIEMNCSKLLRNDDVIERCEDVGIFAKIDAIISEYTM